MDEEDPQERIAELERQLVEQKRVNELERQLAEAKAGTGEHRNTARPPQHQPSQKSALGWMIPVIGFGGIGAAAITAVFPSTALWTSGIVCGSRYHLHYRRSEFSIGNSHSYSSSFQCVSDARSYNVNQLAIIGLQVLPLVLLVCAIAALKWRGRRPLSELDGAYASESSSGNSQTWTITPSGPGPVEIATEGGRTAPFTGKAKLIGRHWKMVVRQPDGVADVDGRGGSGTTTFVWSATKPRGFCRTRTDDGVFDQPAHHVPPARFSLTKI